MGNNDIEAMVDTRKAFDPASAGIAALRASYHTGSEPAETHRIVDPSTQKQNETILFFVSVPSLLHRSLPRAILILCLALISFHPGRIIFDFFNLKPIRNPKETHFITLLMLAEVQTLVGYASLTRFA